LRQINLDSYKVDVRGQDGNDVEVPYDVKNSMIEILFSRDLHLSAREALNRDDLARKIRDCPDGSILLEESDYSKLEKAVDAITGFGRTDVEFIRRILEAPRIQVEEKKK
jgi:hypothetical protein